MIRRSALSLAVAAALPGAMAIPAVALAQDAPGDDEVVEEVVTYGKFRQSLLNSMETKRTNSSIVEAITAEDLGKLPDVSIAESLARLPGLSVQRLNGRGQVVNLRGMSPDFSTGLLNGREQVSVGDNRGVEFDQYPSELLQQVIVYKTPDAALIGQGLSGTIDLRTVRPLDYGEGLVTVNGRLEYAELDPVSSRDNNGQRLSVTYVDQFADDTVGLVFGYAHATTPSFGEVRNAWGYYRGDGAGNTAVGGGRVNVRGSELQRDSITAALDWKPNDNLTLTVDTFFSQFKEDQITHGVVMDLDNGPGDTFPIGLTVLDTRADGLITEGVYDNVVLITENNVFLRDADLQSLGANLTYDFDNGWVASADISHSSVDRADTASFESNGGLGPFGIGTSVPTTVAFTTGGDGTFYEIGQSLSDLNTFGTTAALGWGDPAALADFGVPGATQFGYNKVFDIFDDLNSFRLEVGRDLDFGLISGVEVGYNFNNREKERRANEGVITSNNVVGGALTDFEPIPASIAGTADLSHGLGGGNNAVIAYDPYALLAAGVIQQGQYIFDDIFAKSWIVDEDVHSFYVKLEVDTEIGGMPLSGNFGLQYQSWDQESSGQNASGSGANTVNEVFADSASDSEVLPSLNLNLDITDNQRLRFGVARTLSRPRMDEMRASGFYSYDASRIGNTQADVDALIASGVSPIAAYEQLSPWSRTGGNTQLKPWVADSVDLSYEFYFEDGMGYLAAAYFYKDLDTYIFDQTLLFDFTGLPPQGPAPQLFIGPTTSPQNGQGGEIQGYELAASIDFGLFAPALEGFGIVGNFSNNDSEIEPNGPGSGSRLPGLSENIWNLTVYFERAGFSARINQRYRDGYVGEVAGFGGARTGEDIDDETIVDAQLSYEFQSGALQGLVLLAQAQNLTDEVQQSIDVNWQVPTRTQKFGRSYQIGFTYPYSF